jgi:hypothetical protein
MRQALSRSHVVASRDAHEQEQTGPDGANRLVIDDDAGVGNALQDDSHGDGSVAASRLIRNDRFLGVR